MNNTTKEIELFDFHNPDTIIHFEKPDYKWFNKDLFASSDSYILQSTDIFKTRFDSIMKHYKWDFHLDRGTWATEENYDTYTMIPAENMKIVAKVEKKYQRVTKILLFAEGIGDDFDRSIIKVMKGMILSTLNSNYDSEDAELILHQAGTLNDSSWSGPGVLQKDGIRYESHINSYKKYFGISGS